MQKSLDGAQEAQEAQLQDLKRKTEALADDSSVLRRLYFEDMYKRADNITDATDGTFDWLLTNDDPSSSASTTSSSSDDNEPETPSQQLDEEERQRRQENAEKISEFFEQSGGAFFLRGKPGSGKSTLMKYLTEGRGRPRVDHKLRNWAGQKKLVCVSTMFLLHGTPLQRSLEGFYRTFFFELFCQCPEYMDILFPKRSTRGLSDDLHSSFRLEALQEAWERFLSIKDHEKLKICAFIDGLDELEGNSADRLKFARTLKEWAESDDVKLICSGRPNAEFNIVFDQTQRRLDLQDLTRADVRKILIKRFEEVRHLSDLTQENIEELVNKISYQSEGVILWAVLVGKNLEDDMIHGKPFSSMERTIQTLPRGIEDLYERIWQDLRHDAHHQLMLRTIYELLVLYDGIFGTRALGLFWLEDGLSDDEFPYNEPIQNLSDTEARFRLEKVRSKLVQYTKHFVEVTGPRDALHHEYCRFIHRSAQEFIQTKLGPVSNVSAQRDRTFNLDLRLSLMVEMSLGRRYPTECFTVLLTRPYSYPKHWSLDEQRSVHPLPHRLMDKLKDLLEARRGSISSDSASGEHGTDAWQRFKISYRGRCVEHMRRQKFSIFHLAISTHQVDYVNRILNDRSQPIDQDALCLGLLISVAGWYPNYGLFQILLDHGGNPDCLVEIYYPENDTFPKLMPLWLIFCMILSIKVSSTDRAGPMNGLRNTDLSNEFLILERFLCLGHGLNVKFRAAPTESGSKPCEDDLFGVDLAQVVRLAKPRNMERLLSLLEPPSGIYSSLAQRLASFVLQSHFPIGSLPQGAEITPFSRVSDDYLGKNGWEVLVAFDGEHEVGTDSHYYLPG